MHGTIVIRLMLAAAAACTSSCTSSSTTPPGTAPIHNTGIDPVAGGSLQGRRPFPADNPWNTDISKAALDPNSSTLIASCGLRNLHQDFGTTFAGAPNGIPYIV